ncbi:hypothetical protein D3C78_1203010 [compost metagenome]
MTGVGTHAEARQFSVNLGTAGLGVFVLFEHQHASTLAQDKTVTVLVPGARSCLGIVIARGKRAHGGKATDAQGRHCRFRASGDRHIGVTVFDHATRFTDAMQTGGTCRDHGQIRPLEAETHGHMTGHHVDDGRGHEERRDATRAAVAQLNLGVFDQGQATNARAHHARNARGEFIGQGVARRQARILNGLRRSRNAIVDECVHSPRILGAEIGLQIKPLDLTCNLAGKVRRVELRDEVNSGLAGQNIGPGIRHRVTHGADATQAGHDNATTAHA